MVRDHQFGTDSELNATCAEQLRKNLVVRDINEIATTTTHGGRKFARTRL